MLTPEQWKQQEKISKRIFRSSRNIPDCGIFARYLGKKFIVRRNVFRPYVDSTALVENFTVREGDEVLDVGTGSGVIAVAAAYRGARRVVAVDVNPDAVANAKQNAQLHGFVGVIEARLSDVFSALREGEKFDVITANLPFRDKAARDDVERASWDAGFRANKKFFEGVAAHLKPQGRIYMAQANYGALGEFYRLAEAAGLDVRKIGEVKDKFRAFYAFEMTPKN